MILYVHIHIHSTNTEFRMTTEYGISPNILKEPQISMYGMLKTRANNCKNLK
jgi:hypothetical protein